MWVSIQHPEILMKPSCCIKKKTLLKPQSNYSFSDNLLGWRCWVRQKTIEMYSYSSLNLMQPYSIHRWVYLISECLRVRYDPSIGWSWRMGWSVKELTGSKEHLLCSSPCRSSLYYWHRSVWRKVGEVSYTVMCLRCNMCKIFIAKYFCQFKLLWHCVML